MMFLRERASCEAELLKLRTKQLCQCWQARQSQAPDLAKTPTIVALALVVLIFTVGVVWGKSRSRGFSRYCPKCGRGLNQPADARCCSYCGAALP
jgi:hypothetical protein